MTVSPGPRHVHAETRTHRIKYTPYVVHESNALLADLFYTIQIITLRRYVMR